MSTKKRILFITPVLNSFVKKDVELLKDEFDLIIHEFGWEIPIRLPYSFLRQFVFLIFNFHKGHKVFVHFGGYWSFLPALFGKVFNKKVYLVLHGSDAAFLPDINYGLLRKGISRFFCKYSYKWAYKLLPVSESLIDYQDSYSNFTSSNVRSVKSTFNNMEVNYEVVFNGLDIEFWSQKEDVERKPNTFITVMTEKQIKRKGGRLINQLARLMPEATFHFVGMNKSDEFDDLDNLVFHGRKSQNELRRMYSESSYYLQLSIFEGFGLSLCESMLCGCIPIGSRSNMIPEIIGNAGYVLDKENIDLLHNLLKEIDESQLDQKRIEARQSIIDRFPMERRQQKLIELLS